MENAASYALYAGTVALSVLFAWLASTFPVTRRQRRQLNPLFWTMSFATLWFVMGFRYEVGHDYFNYKEMFNSVARDGFWGFYYEGQWVEPGYILFLRLVDLVWGDFSGVFVCSSFIGLYFFYRAFAFEWEKANPAVSVFVFSSTQYLYYFGIDRLFLAVSLVTYGLRFLMRGQRWKYWGMTAVAASIHLSALWMFVISFIFQVDPVKANAASQEESVPQVRLATGRYLRMVGFMPVLFLALAMVVPHMPSKYQTYQANHQQTGGQQWDGDSAEDLKIRARSIALKLPLVAIILVTLKQTAAFHSPAILYGILYITSIFIQACSSIVPIERLAWFFWVGLCFSFPLMVRACARSRGTQTAIVMFMVLYCLGYMNWAYLQAQPPPGANTLSTSDFLIPYRNHFFEL